MDILFETILERDMDMLLMRQFSENNKGFIDLFIKKTGKETEYSVSSVSHSVMTSDGETDVEAILEVDGRKIAFLIEDKIDAVAQPEQAKRYEIRALKGRENGRYDNFIIFIVAPQKYLEGNQEARKYTNQISYEDIRNTLISEFDLAVIDKALDESKRGYVPIEDRHVTTFWTKLYDYMDERYPDTFKIRGKRGEARGAGATWITISCGHGATINIKADRGYVDLEIAGYADKFQEFSKANQSLLDSKRLYLRMASKSLAIRKYIDTIDFNGDFDDQIDAIEDAFYKAKELQDLIIDLKF